MATSAAQPPCDWVELQERCRQRRWRRAPAAAAAAQPHLQQRAVGCDGEQRAEAQLVRLLAHEQEAASPPGHRAVQGTQLAAALAHLQAPRLFFSML